MKVIDCRVSWKVQIIEDESQGYVARSVYEVAESSTVSASV